MDARSFEGKVRCERRNPKLVTVDDARIAVLHEKRPRKRRGTSNLRPEPVMFEAASAMLASLELGFDTHYGVKIKFGELLVKTGKVDRRFGRYLSRAFDLREDAVYALDTRAEIPREVAERELRKATEFLTMAKQFPRGAGGKIEQS